MNCVIARDIKMVKIIYQVPEDRSWVKTVSYNRSNSLPGHVVMPSIYLEFFL